MICILNTTILIGILLLFGSTSSFQPLIAHKRTNLAMHSTRKGESNTTAGRFLDGEGSGLSVERLNKVFELPSLQNPPPLPGDCDVKTFVVQNVKRYTGDGSFLAPATERTLRTWERCAELMELERQKGILGVDTKKPSTIISHAPGYVLSREEDVIYGLQTDQPLKRSCKPRGGFKVVETALKSYGYEPDADMAKTFGEYVQTHNDLVFSTYTKDMRKARHVHLLTGKRTLPVYLKTMPSFSY